MSEINLGIKDHFCTCGKTCVSREIDSLRSEANVLRLRVAELEQRLKAAEQRMDAYWRVSMKR